MGRSVAGTSREARRLRPEPALKHSQVVAAEGVGRDQLVTAVVGATVTARQLGDRPAQRSGLMLNLGDRVTLDLGLEVSTTELAVLDVRADRESKRAERIGGSTVVTEKEIRQLPIQDRSFADLAILAPTTSRAGTGGIITSSSSIAGGRVSGTDIRVDGVQAKNTIWGAGFGRGPYSISVGETERTARERTSRSLAVRLSHVDRPTRNRTEISGSKGRGNNRYTIGHLPTPVCYPWARPRTSASRT